MKIDYRSRFGKRYGRVIAWRALSALSLDGPYRIPGADFVMYLHPRFRGVGSLSAFALGADYEPGLRLLRSFLRPGDTFLDCGANQGIYALFAASLVGPFGRVLAIEPQPYAAEIIRRSAEANGNFQLETIEAAVCDVEGEADFFVGAERVSAGLNKSHLPTTYRVRTTTIDTLMTDHALRPPAAVKIDVEGAEEAALRGARRCLEAHLPIVQFECFSLDDPSAIGSWGLLKEMGYEFYLPQGERLEPLHERRVESFGIIAAHPANQGRVRELIVSDA